MGRVLLWLVVAGIAVFFAWWLAALPGTVTATVGYTTVQMSVSVLTVCLLLALVVLYGLFRLLSALIHLPRRLRARRALARRRAGDVASTRALVALAAGEIADARREAARARRLLGDTAQTLLLTAEAGERAGRADEATRAFETLTERSDAAFLGYRGLLRQAMDRQDWAEAALLARQAEEAHPGAIWVRRERSQLAIRTANWTEALALADADAPKASLAAAAAEAETDPAQAMKLAKRAWKEDPGLDSSRARLCATAARDGRGEARPGGDPPSLDTGAESGAGRIRACGHYRQASPRAGGAALGSRTSRTPGEPVPARLHRPGGRPHGGGTPASRSGAGGRDEPASPMAAARGNRGRGGGRHRGGPARAARCLAPRRRRRSRPCLGLRELPHRACDVASRLSPLRRGWNRALDQR